MLGSPFSVRGVVEGFYGVYYTFPERQDLIRFLGAHGYNLYIYGPKNDRQHRARWWEPYPDDVLAQFAETVTVAQVAGVTFCYALSPIQYHHATDFHRVTAKLRTLFDCGVRAFCLLVDDIECEAHHDPQCKICERDATPHIELGNDLLHWLRAFDPQCTLSLCPLDYFGQPPFSRYLHALGEGLDPAIDLFYTGVEICAPTVTAADLQSFAEVVRRQPLLWDNYPVNDLAMKGELHIGPLRGRAPDLPAATHGVVANLMLQADAAKIPLLTIAAYLDDPVGYDPDAAWEAALREVGDGSYAALRLFAETSLHSCLHRDDAPLLDARVNAALAALRAGQLTSHPDVRALAETVQSLDEACYHLKNRMRNLALRANLLPWIEALEDWVWLGKRALLVLDRLETGLPYRQPLSQMESSLKDIERQTKRIAGPGLLALAGYAREQVRHVETENATQTA